MASHDESQKFLFVGGRGRWEYVSYLNVFLSRAGLDAVLFGFRAKVRVLGWHDSKR